MPRCRRGRRAPRGHRPLLFIAVSFQRLFLGGLLPSRARFRFAGSLPIPLHTKLAQSRAQPTCLQFRCPTDRVQSRGISSQANDCYNAQSSRVSRLMASRQLHYTVAKPSPKLGTDKRLRTRKQSARVTLARCERLGDDLVICAFDVLKAWRV